jgi:hypothetical protein
MYHVEVFLLFKLNHNISHIFYLVFDDEDEHIITTGAVVTLTIHLQREHMATVLNKEIGSNTSATINTLDDEANDEQIDDKENREKVNRF